MNPLYPVNLTVSIPPELLEIGRKVTQALDQDVGGANSWMPVTEGDEVVGYVADAPVTEAFKEQVLGMLASPELLHGAVVADFAAMWADHVPPTLGECEAFCAGAAAAEPEPDLGLTA